jgi:hypothetical protein
MLKFLALSDNWFKVFSIIGLLSVSHMVFGCAFVTGRYQNVPITTNVPGAKVFIDGRPFGVSRGEGDPLIANLKKSKEHYVTVTKDDYESTTRSLRATLSGVGILDAIGAAIFILPIITVVTGFAYELEPDALYIPLDPLASKKQSPE